MKTCLSRYVGIATIATLLASGTLGLPINAPVTLPSAMAEAPHNLGAEMQIGYYCYIEQDGQLVDCSATASYVEDHVFVNGIYVGDAVADDDGTGNETICDAGGNYVGELVPVSPPPAMS